MKKDFAVLSLTRRIAQHSAALPEGAPLCPNGLLHFGSRAAVDQALSRLARRGRLMRVCQGVYVQPVQTRFGSRPPAIDKVIARLSALWGDVIVPSGAAAANVLGLTEQVPVRPVYLTSGPTRQLQLGDQGVQLRHAPRWQLVAPHRPAGDIVRALAWLGPDEAEGASKEVAPRIPVEDLAELVDARPVLPVWIAEPVSRLVPHHG